MVELEKIAMNRAIEESKANSSNNYKNGRSIWCSNNKRWKDNSFCT